MSDSPAAILHNTSSVEVGTASAPLRVDPTGGTAQPVTDNSASLTVDTPQLPAALVGGRLDNNVGAWIGSTAPTVGQKTMPSSVPVTVASDQPPVSVTFSPPIGRTGVSSAFLTLGGGTANTLNVMRASVYNEPATAAQRSIASANANDTSAGTGARTARITYFDNTGAGPLTEVVTLNGTTAVNTVAINIRFIESLEVVTAGTLGCNAGVVTLYAGTGGTGGVVGSIGYATLTPATGDNRTFWAHHYVAAGWKAALAVYEISIYSGGSATNGRAFVRAAYPLVANSAEAIAGDIILITGTFLRTFQFNPIITGFARLTAYLIPAVNNTTLAAAFDWSETPV